MIATKTPFSLVIHTDIVLSPHTAQLVPLAGVRNDPLQDIMR